MANYVSKHTGAQIDAAVDKTGELDGKVATLTEEIGESPNIQETPENVSDLDVTDAAGNVLMRLANGNIKTKFFDSGNRPGRQEKEIDLSAYAPIDYNIEGLVTWAYDKTHRGILIPASHLAHTNRFFSGTYKMRFAFLRNDNISANVVPDYCLGTGLITISPGQSKYYDLPCDCAYVYVYISDGAYFGQMGILRMSDDFDTFATMRNAEKPAFVASVEQSLLTAKHMNSGVVRDFVGSNVSDNLLTFAHTSDLHTDPTNYTRFLNLLNEHDSIIDFGIVTGDLIDYGSTEEFETMIGCESVLNGNVPLYKCVGNHEVGRSFAALYEAYKPGSGDGSLYFSKDFSAQKIRLIILNQYDNTNNATWSNTGHYSQTQIDWFIGQLQDAITNGLSVIVAMHSMGEAGWPKYNKEGFYQQVLGNMYEPVNSGPIISDIINAFKHKGTLTKTYTYTDGDGSINVSATFNGFGKFVCYVCGHEHVDVIGYSSIYPDQLICMVQAGVIEATTRPESEAHWQSKYDTPRIANTVTADSINVYSIDTVQKLVKVVKVGSTVTDKFETRSFAVFGY